MAQPFTWPSCGATLEYAGTGRSAKCPYCGTTVQVPQEFWQPEEAAQTASQWKKYLILFLVVTVGLPSCLGLLGTALGIGGGIFAAIIPFLVRLFLR